MFAWFDFAWPWFGLGFAAVLVVLLFATPALRSDVSVSRWRDLRWLSFLGAAVYMVHNVEEYGIAANGVVHAFPDSLCEVLGQAPYPECGIPPVFYLFVNLPLVWLAAPLAALLSRRFPLAGVTIWGVIGINAIVHIVPAIVQREYDPGLVTAIALFVPLTVVTFAAVLRRYRRPAIAVLLGAGVLMHAVLAGSLILLLRGLVPEVVTLAAQPAVIAAGYLLVGACGRRMMRR